MAALSSTMSMNYENMTTAELLDTLASLLPKYILGETQEVAEQKMEAFERRAHLNVKINIGLDTALFVFCLGCLLATNRYCVGLIRQISLGKLVLLALICLLKTVESVNVTEDSMMTVLPRRICHALREICHSYNQFFTVFLHYELKNLICKLERQKRELSDFLVRAGIGLALVTVVVGLDLGILAILERFYTFSSAREAIYALKPLCLLLNIIFTILVIYYGQRSLVALRKSSEFRQQSHVQKKSANENRFVRRVIIISIAFQLTKLIFRIAKTSADAFFSHQLMECTSRAKTLFQVLGCTDEVKGGVEINSYILRIYWPHLLEQIAVNIVMMQKQKALGH